MEKNLCCADSLCAANAASDDVVVGTVVPLLTANLSEGEVPNKTAEGGSADCPQEKRALRKRKPANDQREPERDRPKDTLKVSIPIAASESDSDSSVPDSGEVLETASSSEDGEWQPAPGNARTRRKQRRAQAAKGKAAKSGGDKPKEEVAQPAVARKPATKSKGGTKKQKKVPTVAAPEKVSSGADAKTPSSAPVEPPPQEKLETVADRRAALDGVHNELTKLLAKQDSRCQKATCATIYELFSKVASILSAQEQEIASLRAENMTLKEVIGGRKTPVTLPEPRKDGKAASGGCASYATVAARPAPVSNQEGARATAKPRRVPATEHTLLVYPTDKTMNSEQTRSLLKTNINPTKLRIGIKMFAESAMGASCLR
ncbi:uncharacterized protein [Centruroides vittatus]|uniref:uncharacterized protein n=1 Tax=Centruroides vittatus TaxID=120091 RepID=UPI00351093AF